MPSYNTQTTNYIRDQIIGAIFETSGGGSITIFSGSQPTADTVATSWSSYKTDQGTLLAHYATARSYSYNSATRTYYFTNPSLTGATTCNTTGTATWAILWEDTLTALQVAGSSLPDSNFLVVPVGTTASNAIIRFTNTNFVGGQSVAPYDGGITMPFA